MKIVIETIPHTQQRYPTVGDWEIAENGDITIRVSEMGNPDYEFCVALHELVETYLCKRGGVDQHAVTAFDEQFERDREAGKHAEDEEPGDQLDAPYRLQHQFATELERLMAARLGLDWSAYDEAVQSL